jgi:hypothetical protein
VFASDDEASFSALFSHGIIDQELPVGPDDGNRAYFGRDVLRGLIEGIDDFAAERQQRWRRYRAAPALLGTASWIDDEELLVRLGRMASCIVITKQGRRPRQLQKLARLREINQASPGIPAESLMGLGGMAPKIDGKPAIIGPDTPIAREQIEAIRTLGYRKQGQRLVPIPHAKLVLLGHLWWSDEGALGHVEDVTGFKAIRLWISSANLTGSSRHNLEFGYWTEDPNLVNGTKSFLEGLISVSEDLDPESDTPSPDFAPFEFDDAAFTEHFADMDSGDDEDADEPE